MAATSSRLSPRVYHASKEGAVADCNIAARARVGGGVPTDNAAALNAILATATATSPIELVLDGGFAIGAPLTIPTTGHVTISGLGWDTGLFVLSGSNCGAIQTANFGPTDLDHNNAVHATPPLSIAGYNLVLRDFHIDANKGVFPTGAVDASGVTDGTLLPFGAPTPDSRGPYPYYYLTTVTIGQIRNFRCIGLSVYDPTTYCVNLFTCHGIVVTGCRFQGLDPDLNHNRAGVQTEGGCTSIDIHDNEFIDIDDDNIAVNCNEGDGQPSGDIHIHDNRHFNGQSCVRIHGKSVQTRRVFISNITAVNNRNRIIDIGDEDGAASAVADCNHSIFIDGIDASVAPGFLGAVFVNGNVGHLDVRRVRLTDPTQAVPILNLHSQSVVSSLTIAGCGVHRSAAGSAMAYMLKSDGGTVGNLMIDGWNITDQSGQSYANVPALISLTGSAAITRVWAGSLDGRHATAFIDNYTNVGSIGGPGLVASGFGMADARVGPNSTYYSTTAPGLCYKDPAGVVKLFNFGTTAPATAYTLGGPSTGVVGVASDLFTVTPNGVFSGTITVTPSGAGVSTPVVLTFSSSSTPQSFTITAASTGTVTLTPTNSASLTNPSALSYVASLPSSRSLHAMFSVDSGNGLAQPLQAASQTALQAHGTSFSIGCFVRFTSLPAHLVGMIVKLSNSPTTNEYAMWYENGTQNIAFWTNNGTTNTPINCNTTITTGIWYFMVGVWDASIGKMLIYTNGASDQTPVTCTQPQSQGTAFVIGNISSIPNSGLDGSLSMVFKYSSALTPTLISWLYNSGLGRSTAEILGHAGLTTPDCLYGFDSSGALGTDSGPNSITLANVNTLPIQGVGPGGSLVYDQFTGTPGTSITGRMAGPIAHGTDTWQSEGALATWVIAPGGSGVTTATGGATCWSFQPLVGVTNPDVVPTIQFTATTTTNVPQVSIRRNGASTTFIIVAFDYAGAAVKIDGFISGASVASTTFGRSFVTGTVYTCVIVPTSSGGSTTVKVVVNGGTVGSFSFAQPALQAAGYVEIQNSGTTAGTVTILSFRVD